jgi:hypothetical protein
LGTASEAHDGCIDCQTTDERPAVYKPYYEQSYAENTSRFELHADTTTMAINADQWKQHTLFGLTEHIIRLK